MEGDKKVFTSEIIRAQKPIHNNLYELIKVIPATPVTPSSKNEEITLIGDFHPDTGKQYTPKKRSRLKVKTVRDIRLSFEQDEISYLTEEIEKQQQYLFRKIKSGCSKDIQTKNIAKKIMSCDKPLSRSALQMLMTINPFDRTCYKQYVLFNGKQICISGSTGGKKPNLHNFDISERHLPPRSRPKVRATKDKKGLLRNSLAVKFKPGPLIKKANLDDSYQKYNVGSTELVKIPKVAFSIQPSPRITLEHSISRFVQSLRNKDGIISETWAEYSVSALCKANNENMTQCDKAATVTFDLNYKCDQMKILMRRDIDSIESETLEVKGEETILKDEDSFNDIKRMLSQMLDAVEINLIQDTIFLEDDTPREHCDNDPGCSNTNLITHAKDKKKKRFTELDKLDVTVIQLPAEEYKEEKQPCANSFCSLGCICPSLMNPCKIKQHCGRIECMFQCKCDFSKYALNKIKDTELLSGIINFNNEINFKLSKEEQKFHQTVVVTGDQGIVLKSQKRQWKPSKRYYADFDTDVSFKTDLKLRQQVSVVMTKLSCENIEPWCMVHNLYKCFCKGILTDTVPMACNTNVHIISDDYAEVDIFESNSDSSISKRKSSLTITQRSKTISTDDSSDQSELSELSERCARCAMPYERKYKDSFYGQMNKKISEMEKNDENLRKRLLQLMNVQSLDNEKCGVSHVNQDQRHQTPPLTQDDEPYDGKRRVLRPSRYKSEKFTIQSTHFETKTRDSHYKPQNTTETSIPLQVSQKQSEIVEVIEEQSRLGQVTEDSFVSTPDVGTAKRDESIRTNVLPPTANEVLPKDKSRLMEWLVSSYQMYKRRERQGKIVVDPPKNKKLVLYPVSFIQSRYTERKNIFMVTRNKPYRLFMAVDTKNTFLEKCINISCIRMTDLHKYPVTVQNLIKGDADCDDNFYILCGLRCCWEFVGSISKISDRTPTYSALSESTENLTKAAETNNVSIKEKSELFGESSEHHKVLHNHTESEDDKKQCKWFVLTVESDFSEIQFSERGFFVKHESIIKAINVARLSKKTVRLSSQKSGEEDSDPQFGIYAVPRTDDYCVFIGPYQNEESLGIEIIESKQSNSKTSKGFWISTEKKDNYKVIDNPLSFLSSPTHSKSCTEYKTLRNQPLKQIPAISNSDIKKPNIITIYPEVLEVKRSATPTMLQTLLNNKPKPIKPIKISKAGGVYYLMQKGRFTKLDPEQSILNHPAEDLATDNPRIVLPTCSKSILKSSKVRLEPTIENAKPIAEIAPQIKIVDVYSESSTQPENSTANSRRGMFILKPDEINKRLMKDVYSKAPDSDTPHTGTRESGDRNLDSDIENFLATSSVYVPSNADILMESEEEIIARKPKIKEVFIACKTVENLGWIPGKRNPDNYLSFKFPGFVHTEFYPEAEAFSKINQVFSRKVYVPANIKLEWEVFESVEQIQCKEMLSPEQLGLDFVLTRRGLRHKRDIITYVTSYKSRSSVASVQSLISSTMTELSEVEKASDVLNEIEDEIEELDDRNKQLMQEFAAATTTSPALLSTISDEICNNQREQMAEALKDLLSSAADDTA